MVHQEGGEGGEGSSCEVRYRGEPITAGGEYSIKDDRQIDYVAGVLGRVLQEV